MTNQARLSTISCLLGLCALSACDTDTEALAGDIELRDFELRGKTADPSQSSQYDRCVDSGTFNGRATRIRHPEGFWGCAAPLSDLPLVVMLPGTGFEYTDYTYLLDHLAENGFVAISVDVLADEYNEISEEWGHEQASETIVGVLDDFLTNWEHADHIDPTNIALVGHSRGGRTARYVADELDDPYDDWAVRAIVTLASKAGSDRRIGGNETEALLVLQGSMDADQPPERAYEIYDGSDAETISYDGTTLTKAMKLLENADHGNFAEGTTAQARAAKGYVLAFLAQHLLDDDHWYEDYIRGDEIPYVDVPGGFTGDVASQYRDETREVVDNFEDDDLSYPSIGGSNGVTLGTTASVIDLESETLIQHETYALELGGIANGEFWWSFTGRDVSSYAWLSLRVGYLDDNGARGLSVSLRNDGVWSSPVSLFTHGEIQHPMTMCATPNLNGICPVTHEYAHMGTVRVPLSAFTGDVDNVSGVRLIMGSKYASTTFLIDSVEFAGSN